MTIQIDATRRAILDEDGHLLIVGGPGCGKTTIALQLAQAAITQLAPEQKILFLSFSRAAVRQISDRMKGVVARTARDLIEIRTFHAFFLDVVRAHSSALTGVPAFFITPDAEQRMRFDRDEDDWEAHTSELARAGRFVFDRLADTAAKLLEGSEALRSLYSSTYPLVIVDEFQDTNVDQWRAVRAMSKGSRIIALADPDQRIYEGFVKGVDEHRIEHLRAALSPAEFDLGSDNYRSPVAGILAYANAVLAADAEAEAPDSVQTVTYRYASDFESLVQRGVAWLDQELTSKLGHKPSLAVLSTDNATVASLSEKLTNPTAGPRGEIVPPIDHQLHFEAELAAAAGYVVASILEWPTFDRSEAIRGTVDACIDYYRTVGGSTAKKKAAVLVKGRDAFLDLATIRSKTVRYLVEQYDVGIEFAGDPVTDWHRARGALTGTPELLVMFQHVRHLRMLNAGDDLAWALLGTWNGVAGYEGATGVVRRVVADRILDDSRVQQSLVNLMNMYRSKGKEFDGVVIAEGRYRAHLLDRAEHFPANSARRRVLRVALTRARHQVLMIRPEGFPPLTAVPVVPPAS